MGSRFNGNSLLQLSNYVPDISRDGDGGAWHLARTKFQPNWPKHGKSHLLSHLHDLLLWRRVGSFPQHTVTQKSPRGTKTKLIDGIATSASFLIVTAKAFTRIMVKTSMYLQREGIQKHGAVPVLPLLQWTWSSTHASDKRSVGNRVYFTFVDLTKTFNTDSRAAPYKKTDSAQSHSLLSLQHAV